MTEEDKPKRPKFRSGLSELRKVQDEGEISFNHDLILIRHHLADTQWPAEAKAFAERVLTYFPDPDDDADSDWPDWSAGDILEWILKDLAKALERPKTK